MHVHTLQPKPITQHNTYRVQFLRTCCISKIWNKLLNMAFLFGKGCCVENKLYLNNFNSIWSWFNIGDQLKNVHHIIRISKCTCTFLTVHFHFVLVFISNLSYHLSSLCMKNIFQKIIGKLFVAQLYTTTVKLCLSNLPDYFNLSYRRKAVYTERCIADD